MIVTKSLAARRYPQRTHHATLGAFFVPIFHFMVGAMMGFYTRRAVTVLLTSLPLATQQKGHTCQE